MRKEAKILLDRGVASLVLSVEHFNRPSDLGRVDAVLILMDHAFEMLLKAAIIHRSGRIREPRAKMTIGFDHSVRVGLSDGKIRFLSEAQAGQSSDQHALGPQKGRKSLSAACAGLT